ncbi:putative csbD-like protein [Mycolicibacterium hassiacum DSM 44199]|jgi:uncharacterized protein YjbJ (UPF0337 family)|uniref:Putative csbD-like protein n=1 Tax=Mycolicibacterium hassiacum (strain DSM 44199 / CIP 105218 / JCM 12690 / 3849) TaxID=1122247 RepID=K5BI09_MYCHD|nr:CsbD family protein [Mycolicibacterium hassiacum]EKF25501.1 putative csbD-like protein [Mycolicibacterium hassiacum DSM 44199]MBX5486579.1 CsbD family protein [Mycolicibacterium hassiacum]MDA4086643.1 general stress protein CsbD [Mycolicibacterium hassiacum DSM 44199]PZN22507.1 MAG: CsbD family protein [Mycolicibacterium hassiacum]VCT92873.1 hypothetical protein MHAS_04608 [Mycolicibacterium hassiacum DSM 44199]
MSANRAQRTRRGLLDSVRGKVKQIVGSVTGNDSLTTEGHLQEVVAHQRQAAEQADAVAAASAEQAEAKRLEAERTGAEQRAAVRAEAAARKQEIDAGQAAEQRAVRDTAHQDLAAGLSAAEQHERRRIQQAEAERRTEQRDAAADVTETLDEHRGAVRASAKVRAEADRLRAEADRLADQSDVPETGNFNEKS